MNEPVVLYRSLIKVDDEYVAVTATSEGVYVSLSGSRRFVKLNVAQAQAIAEAIDEAVVVING